MRARAARRESVLILGAGLSGLAAADALLDHGLRVTIVDSFPVVGGRVSSFEVPTAVSGLVPGDVVEHGLHGFFQHYHALYALMQRAGLSKPPFASTGVHFFALDRGHFAIEGGPLVWLLNALRLPGEIRGSRAQALSAFARLIAELRSALARPEETDRHSARSFLERFGVPEAAIDKVFAPCLFSLTSLRTHELSALEMLRWFSHILPDPRVRGLPGGGTACLCAPIAASLRERGAQILLGVEVTRLSLDARGRAELALAQAPDRTGVRHLLVPDFQPSVPPDASAFDAVVSTLPCDRLRALLQDSAPSRAEVWSRLAELDHVHPLTIRLWFERPIEGAEDSYILSSGTLFDVLRPTPEPGRYAGIRLIDALVENIETHLPELPYRGERYLEPGPLARAIETRVLGDLERLYPGQIRDNRVLRRFLHTREGIIAGRPGSFARRPPQYVGSPHFVLGGDFTRHAYGVCMEGAVRAGQLAARSLLAGRQVEDVPGAFDQAGYSIRILFEALQGERAQAPFPRGATQPGSSRAARPGHVERS